MVKINRCPYCINENIIAYGDGSFGCLTCNIIFQFNSYINFNQDKIITKKLSRCELLDFD